MPDLSERRAVDAARYGSSVNGIAICSAVAGLSSSAFK